MNYILEIKAFYDWLEVNQLPTSAIALWHGLMHMANKTGWKDNFTVAIVVLEIKTGLKKQAIMNARTILQNKGLITFKSRGGNQSATYKINSFVSFKEAQNHTQGDTQEHTQEHTINKQNKTKQNEINNTTPFPPSQGKKDKKLFSLDSFEFLASRYLRDSILERIPKANVPKSDENLQSWAIHIDYLKRLDNLTEKEIRTLIKFATTDSFWQSNILSTKNLRKHKDKLMAKMQEKQCKGVTINDSWRAVGTSSTNKKDFEEYGEEL